MKMKILGLFLLSSISAFAGYRSITIGNFTDLPDCGGSLTVKSGLGGEQVILHFERVRDCSNFDIVSTSGIVLDYSKKKLGGIDRARSGDFVIPKSAIGYGNNSVQVLLHSNRKKTSDTIDVEFVTEPTSDGSTTSTGTDW